MVGIAQLVRAPDCGSGGHRFESDYPPHYIIYDMMGYRQVGKAQDFDSCIRWFESSYPCQQKEIGFCLSLFVRNGSHDEPLRALLGYNFRTA